MEEAHENRTDDRRRERLVERLDQMVESGQVTDQEAERLRAAGEPGEFDHAVVDMRVRHAASRLSPAVQDGSLTQEEADGFLERLRTGEHPRSLRAQLRSLRPVARSLAPVRGEARPKTIRSRTPPRE
jgi:polyhydroxyalkanoate synthesis regulator phasin